MFSSVAGRGTVQRSAPRSAIAVGAARVPGARMPCWVISERTRSAPKRVVRLGGRSPAALSRSAIVWVSWPAGARSVWGGQQLPVVGQLVQARDRADRPTAGLIAAGPGDGDVDLF